VEHPDTWHPRFFGGKSFDGYDGFAADIWACGVILFIMLAGFPPFQKPDNSDWWYNKLSSNKHALFWQAHSRSAYFSEQTKDFINKILNPDPAKRISIADMKKHPWWRGAIVSNAQLVAELQRRKHTVDEVKERERERKRGERGLEAVVMRSGEHFLRGDEPVVEEDDVLPISPPKLTFRTFVFKEPTHRASDVPMEYGPEEPVIVRAPPKALPEFVRYTRFETVLSPERVFERLSEVIESNRGKQNESKDEYRIKAIFGDVQFFIEIFSSPDSKDSYVVDFRKKQGSAEEFREYYQYIRAQLADVVLQPKPSPAAASPPAPDSPLASPSPASPSLASPAAPPEEVLVEE